MPKRAIKEKKAPNDLDLLNMFLHGKFNSKIETENLKMRKHPSGAIYLIDIKSDKVIAEYGRIEGSVGNKNILLVNPIAGTAEVWRGIFGGFPSQNIYYKIGMTPIDIHLAMQIYTQTNSPLLQMEE